MAGPGTKRTDSPGALPQTPPNQARGGSSRRPVLGNHRPAADPWRSPYPPDQPMQTSSHKAEGPPQVARCSPPKTDLAEVPSTPGGPSRNSAMPVLRVRGEGVPAILYHRGPCPRAIELWHLFRHQPHYMPVKKGRARLGDKIAGGHPPVAATNLQPCPVVPKRPLPYSPASADRCVCPLPRPSLAAGCTITLK